MHLVTLVLCFIKNRVTNGENKVNDAADDLENVEVKKKNQVRKPKEQRQNMQLKNYFLKKENMAIGMRPVI